MQRKKKRLTALLLYVPLLLIAYLLQDTVFSELPIGGARPLILPVAVVGAAMFGGRLRGGVFGLCAGILCDVSLCRPAVLFTLLLTLAAELVLFFLNRSFEGINVVVALIFCLYIGFDWARAQRRPCTADNAIDSACALYLDIINLALRILASRSRRRN